MIARAIVHIFEGKDAEEDDDTMYDVRVSYIEIYNEEIRDLLGDDPTKKLEIKVRTGWIDFVFIGPLCFVKVINYCDN